MEPTHENETSVETTAPTSSTPQVCTASPENSESVSFYKRHLTLILSIVVGLLIVLGAGYYTYIAQKGIVATVNGKNIYATDLAENIMLIEQNASAQGVDISKAETKVEIRNQALEILINNSLLVTAAEATGIEVTEADIQTKYDEIVKELGSPEELEKRMAEISLTKEKLLSNIKERILVDAYLEANTDIKNITVTDDEVNEFVKSIVTGDQKLPPLEEIRPQIEEQIKSQKQQKVVADLIATLRTEAKVDVRTE